MKKFLLVMMLILSAVTFSNNNGKSEVEQRVYDFIKSRVTGTAKLDMEEIYEAVINSSKEFDVDPQLVVAIIHHESGFDQFAESPAGAIGFMQLMPGTAKNMGVKDIYGISDNIRGGVKYLKKCLNKTKNDIPLALASYNAGLGNVLKYKGIPPFKETRNYVDKVLTTYNKKFGGNIVVNEVEFKKEVNAIFSEIVFSNADEGEI